ncbi:MAG: OmpA family protein [Anaerolineae bacterium]|nr:OmpA family protein [Gemmatimonadaceae bacterium]
MTRRARIVLALAAAIFAVTASACKKKQPPVPPAPEINQDSLAAAERVRADSVTRADAARRDSLARAQAAASAESAARDAARLEEVRSTLTAPVYFDYDSDGLSDETRVALDAKIPVLNANPSVRLRIAGHADERGSDEHNLALGQRRAAAAKRYLSQRGIADSRIEIISFGEERPAMEGSDESAWSQNRRDEFEITAGGDRLNPPS